MGLCSKDECRPPKIGFDVTLILGNGNIPSLFNKNSWRGQGTKATAGRQGLRKKRKVSLSQHLCSFIELLGPGKLGKGTRQREGERGEKLSCYICGLNELA